MGVPDAGVANMRVAMLLLLCDVHGNLPALEAVLADAGEVEGCLIGGDVALFGPWPLETVECPEDLGNARWLRGNGERWTGAPDESPDNDVFDAP